MARRLALTEGANLWVVELAALCHDLEDWKLSPQKRIEPWLSELGVDVRTINQVLWIAENLSFKGADVAQAPLSLEGQVVQDADRLDAIGAIGIARAFAYGGYKGRLLYDPSEQAQRHERFEDYQKSQSSSLMHFYEKLLLLKDRLNTPSAKAIAQERHRYMESFVLRFLQEWQGEA